MHTILQPLINRGFAGYTPWIYTNYIRNLLEKVMDNKQKKTLKKEEEDSCFSRPYTFS